MSLKKFGAVLIAVLALSAVAVSSASAAATTESAQWYTGASPGTTLAVGKAETLKAEVGTDPVVGKQLILTTEVGTPPQPLELTTTEAECVGCVIEIKTLKGPQKKRNPSWQSAPAKLNSLTSP